MRPKGISSTFVCCWTVASIIWKICHFERTTMIPSLGLAWRTPRSPPNHLGKWRRLGGRPKRLRFGMADAADTGFSSFDSCSRSIVAGFQMSCGKFSPCHFDYILVLYTIQWGKTFSENLPLLLSTKPKYIISAWDNCRAKWSLNFSARIISSTLRSVIHQVGLPCATQLCVVMSRSWKPCWRRKGILMTKQRHFGPRNLSKSGGFWVNGRKAWKKPGLFT